MTRLETLMEEREYIKSSIDTSESEKEYALTAIDKLITKATPKAKAEKPKTVPETETLVPVAVSPKEEKQEETPKKAQEKPEKNVKQEDFKQVLKIVDSSPDVAAFGKADTYNQNNSINLGMAAKLLNQNNLSIKSVNQEAIIEKFKLKGFEYGNWATQTERFNFLIACKISFEQLKDLGFENLGLDGKIIVSFGARGQGGAAAHFEPKTFAINLTKKRGFGVFTHEYGHALDYFFGTYIDQDATSLALSYGHKTGVIALDGFEKTSMRYLMNDLVNDIIQNTELLQRLDKNVGRENDYWYRRNEIFARMFEQSIHTVLDSKNDFLVNNKYEDFCYLTKNEYLKVVPKMKSFLDKIKPYLKLK